MLKTDDIKQITNLAKDGDVSKINLLIKDISAKPLPGLPMSAVASLFSNAKTNASREDIAKGLIWMVLQCIGSATILSSLESGIKDFVLIGNLSLLPLCREVYPAMEKVYGVRFHVPKYSEFCTRLQASTKIEHKNTSIKALFHTHLQERTDKQEVIRFGQPLFYRVVQNDFLYA